MDTNKVLAFITLMLLKVSTNQELTENEIQQLDNLTYSLGSYDLDEKEFRY